MSIWNALLATGLLLIGGVSIAVSVLSPGSWRRRAGAVAVAVVCVVAVIHLANDAKDRADRKVRECEDRGGVPDRYGRWGTRVECRFPQENR